MASTTRFEYFFGVFCRDYLMQLDTHYLMQNTGGVLGIFMPIGARNGAEENLGRDSGFVHGVLLRKSSKPTSLSLVKCTREQLKSYLSILLRRGVEHTIVTGVVLSWLIITLVKVSMHV